MSIWTTCMSFSAEVIEVELWFLFGQSYNCVIHILCCNAGIPRIAFILTDGKASMAFGEDAKNVKDLEVNVYAIGIGNGIDVAELEQIASSPADRYVSTIGNYHSISSLVLESLTKICYSKCYVVHVYVTGFAKTQHN